MSLWTELPGVVREGADKAPRRHARAFRTATRVHGDTVKTREGSGDHGGDTPPMDPAIGPSPFEWHTGDGREAIRPGGEEYNNGPFCPPDAAKAIHPDT
ncbi:hypothetical protein EV284_4707 [Streptomyces sp. BK022]|nr:hypothetical protein EV284_4707 [Streptomyces sp. BK022]